MGMINLTRPMALIVTAVVVYKQFQTKPLAIRVNFRKTGQTFNVVSWSYKTSNS